MNNMSKFDESSWMEVLSSVEKTYSILAKNQQDLEQKNQSLGQMQQFLSNVLASMTDVLLVCDNNGKIMQCNQALEKMCGTKEQDLLDKHFTKAFKVDSPEQLKKFYNRESVIDCEIEVKTKLGVELFSVNCSPRFDRRNRIIGKVFIGRPIGQLKRAYSELQQTHDLLKKSQEELIESEKMASLGRLISGIAHELNNPISFVYGNVFVLQSYLDVIKEHIFSSDNIPDKIQDIFDDLPELLAGMVEGLERTESVIKGLRNFSSVHKEEMQRTDLSSIITTSMLWTKKTYGINTTIDDNVPEGLFVYGNAGKLHQVFVNLFQNAFDAMKNTSKPKLCVQAQADEKQVTVKIKDNGKGIEKEEISYIFDPFFSTKKLGQGMGLGLYICYNIVKEHKGKLEALLNSDSGVTFTLTLPKASHYA